MLPWVCFRCGFPNPNPSFTSFRGLCGCAGYKERTAVRCRVCIGGSRLVAAFGPRRPARRAALPALAQAVAADRTRSLLPTRPALPPPMRSVCCGASPNPSPCGWLTAASLVHPLSNTRAAAGCVQSPSHQTQPADLRERERWGGHRLVILDSVARIGFDTIGGDGTGVQHRGGGCGLGAAEPTGGDPRGSRHHAPSVRPVQVVFFARVGRKLRLRLTGSSRP